MHVACASFHRAVWQGVYNARGYTRAEWKAAGHRPDTWEWAETRTRAGAAMSKHSPLTGQRLPKPVPGRCCPKAARALQLYDQLIKPGPCDTPWIERNAVLNAALMSMTPSELADYYAGVSRRVHGRLGRDARRK